MSSRLVAENPDLFDQGRFDGSVSRYSAQFLEVGNGAKCCYRDLHEISVPTTTSLAPEEISPHWSGWLYKQSRGFRKGGILGKYWQKRMFQLFKVLID